ncbi:diguanylate cyclase/phosphodiesterase (GGDEF & EAL domains) with PAS/PAC sensor(s) [hydrothermal vent metagenome]|uniref:Diguanylate cyclase/phosphodiesterase (GGDEF & EAL domains) with PAS/PAC sensor(S) n=1 Tax=hydrothermal vent metagenome TaxID=652676 RepID=A0A3B1A195_9ZZZZ
MQEILFIEHSATLRHAMKQSLINHSYVVDIHEDFETGLKKLTEHLDQYEAIILGWPEENNTSTDEMLAILCEAPYDEIPLVVLSHEVDSAKIGWVSSRLNTAFIMWDSFEDTVKTLPQLLTHQFVEEPFCDIETDLPITILLVDDSPTARVKFRKILDSCGYLTTTASSSTEAFDLATQQKFDIAIIDYFMPDENGDLLCKKLRNNTQTANIRSAVLTSTYSDRVIQSALSAGAIECMFKNEPVALFKARVAAMSRGIRITNRIEQERTRLEGILTSVGDGVYGVNTAGIITFVNPATRNILGYRADEELIGSHPDALFHKYESVNTYASTIDLRHLGLAIKEGKELQGVETIFTRTDGTPIQVELTIFPLRIDGKHEGAVVAFRDVSIRKLLEEELKWQANHDPLTKLLNRKYLEDQLDHEVQRLKRSDEISALVYIDLDRFKYINDTIGHAAGDQLLIEISQQLLGRLRKSDLLGHLGGDEFGIVLRNVDHDNLFSVADNFRELFSSYDFVREGRSYKIHASIGVAIIDCETVSYGEVLANADIACHIAKGQGRNSTHIYDPDHHEKSVMDLELGWSTRIQTALEKDSFHLYFQPIMPLADLDLDDLPEEGNLLEYLVKNQSNHCSTYEVLLRLHNGHGEPISPNAFMPTAERFNMMPDIDQWVLSAAMKRMAALEPELENVTFTINLSGQSLDPDILVPLFSEGIKKYKLDPARFLFEITETTAINDTFAANKLISELKKLGCRFALDDFGSGYCSFSHLKRLPVDYIKIDGMFVKDILNDTMDMAIVRSITNIAHTLGKETVAEFVESADAIRLLKDCGVDYIQGFYIAKPAPVIFKNNLQETKKKLG